MTETGMTPATPVPDAGCQTVTGYADRGVDQGTDRAALLSNARTSAVPTLDGAGRDRGTTGFDRQLEGDVT